MMQTDNILRIMDITYSSSVDGVGFRDVLFVNYCPHHCDECHNPETWDKKNGRDVTVDEVYEKLMQSAICNVTFSGGEPFEQPKALLSLAKKIKENSSKTIWAYSGYTFEQLIKDPDKKALLQECEVLVDGKFDKTKKGLNLRFKGSENQRIIDVQKTLETGEITLWED